MSWYVNRGFISVQKDKWYRLTFWAKGEGIKGSGVSLALLDTRVWRSAGLSDMVFLRPEWRSYEYLFQSEEDLSLESSRLQFAYRSTGVFWLDDVALVESSTGRQWHPQIPTNGAKNFIPNSSFECGGANWGSITFGLKGWGGNLYRLYGEADASTAVHGKQSWKLALTQATLPLFHFYFEGVRQPVQ